VDILKRLPDDETTTLVELEKNPTEASPGSERGSQLIRDEVIPPLEKLMQDDDVDVRYFATTASKAWTDSQDNAMET
jgi:serine/threonine-protein phosphatase 2A regulatory subunit A